MTETRDAAYLTEATFLTDPARAFLAGQYEMIRFYDAINGQARALDVLQGVSSIYREDEAGRTVMDTGTAMGRLLGFHLLWSEMFVCRMVDGYLSFLSATLALVFETRPETLRTQDQFTAAFLLEFETMTDLRAAMAEKKVLDLAMIGVRELARSLQKMFGFAIFETDYEVEAIAEFVEIRNLVVHNRGVVNRRFLSRLPEYHMELGQKLPVGQDTLISGFAILERSARNVDTRAAEKFGLPRQPCDLAEMRRGLTDSPLFHHLHEVPGGKGLAPGRAT